MKDGKQHATSSSVLDPISDKIEHLYEMYGELVCMNTRLVRLENEFHAFSSSIKENQSHMFVQLYVFLFVFILFFCMLTF